MFHFITRLVQSLQRFSYCRGCGDRTYQEKTDDGWLCPCGYMNKS